MLSPLFPLTIQPLKPLRGLNSPQFSGKFIKEAIHPDELKDENKKQKAQELNKKMVQALVSNFTGTTVQQFNTWKQDLQKLFPQSALIEFLVSEKTDNIKMKAPQIDWSRLGIRHQEDGSHIRLNYAYLANLSGANLSFANIFGANFCAIDLFGANLFGANLSGANLSLANLEKANLEKANLEKANQYKTNLSEANLSEANLSEAFLEQANLSRANLSRANLFRANLKEANLSGANLSGANLLEIKVGETDLSGTALDPNNPIPSLTVEAAQKAGFTLENDTNGQTWAIGYQTKNHLFYMGELLSRFKPTELIFTAPLFSTDTTTEDHPGLYLYPTREEFQTEHPTVPFIQVKTPLRQLIQAGNKFRTKTLTVLETV